MKYKWLVYYVFVDGGHGNAVISSANKVPTTQDIKDCYKLIADGREFDERNVVIANMMRLSND